MNWSFAPNNYEFENLYGSYYNIDWALKLKSQQPHLLLKYNLVKLATGKDWPHVGKLIPERVFDSGMFPLAWLTGPCMFYGPPKTK